MKVADIMSASSPFPPIFAAQTTSVRVSLRAGANTIRIANDADVAHDLDRLSIA